MARRPQIDVGPFAMPQAWKKAGGRAGKKAGEFTLVTQSIQHGEILPASLATAAGCVTSGGKGPRIGQVELVFVRRSTKKGAPSAGPALRFCTAKGKGAIVPVNDPREAKKIAQRYQACVGDKKAKTKSCILDVKGR